MDWPAWSGPAELVAVRHGESTLNAAGLTGFAEVLAVVERDPDVPLSALGEVQSARLGRWFAGLPDERLPDLVLCSPFARARETARLVLAELDLAGRPLPPLHVDERLRDRETGVLDLFHSTTASPAAHLEYPEEWARRRRLGELYYRPSGGESLADVAVRLRGVLADLHRTRAGRRVLVVGHDAVVAMLRFVVESLSEDDLHRIIRTDPARNASVTRWAGVPLRLVEYNRVDHLG
jgi:broad specificity phosphatase PhoE